MTLLPDPTQILAHGKAHKTQTQCQPCQELKMPIHSIHCPPIPDDGLHISFKPNICKNNRNQQSKS